MKVLFVGSHLDQGGGLALQSLHLFQELKKSVDGTYLCLRGEGPHSELLEQDGIRVVGTLRFPQGILDLRSAIRAERGDWDIVHVFDVYFGLPAAYLARAYPRIVLFGTDIIWYTGSRYGAPGRFVTRHGLQVLMRDTSLVVNSPDLAASYPQFSPIFIPNGLDVESLGALPSKEEARRQLGLPSDARLVLWVGKVIFPKRVEWLLDALREIPDALLVAVGGYNEKHFGDSYLRGLQSKYRDVVARATFTGEVPFSRIGLYLAAADVFAFPSVLEGMPSALLEAMAAALPVVASDIPAHRAFVRSGETGLLARDPHEFAERISVLLHDPSLRAQIGTRARDYVRSEFTFDRAGRRYLDLYRRILETS